MTITEAPPAPPPLMAPAAPPRPARPSLRVVGATVTLLGAVLVGFLLDVAGVGRLQHDRTQQTMFADFRADLAEATAPVGQGDDNDKPLKLGTPVAVLDIPALGVSEVVVEGTNSGTTEKGPGHRRDTVLPGQKGVSVIMGRRAAYGGPFADLAMLIQGETITATTGQGKSTYTVRGVRRPGDPVPPQLADGAGRLTLVTAAGRPFIASDVLYVDADLTSTPQDTPSRLFGATALPASEKAMASDSGAWVPLVLWGQCLVLAAAAVSFAAARWGRRQAWLAGVPVLAALGFTVADQILRLLPNLL